MHHMLMLYPESCDDSFDESDKLVLWNHPIDFSQCALPRNLQLSFPLPIAFHDPEVAV
jgi:hypothetical protein